MRELSGVRHPTQGQGKLILTAAAMVGADASTLCVSSHAPSTNSQPQGARGFLPKTIYCISQQTPVFVLHTQTLSLHAAFPGEGAWGEAGKSLPAAEGLRDEPSDPFPHLPSSPGTGRLTDGAAWEGTRCDPSPGNKPHAWLFPGTARTVLAQGKWLRALKGCGRDDHEQDGSKARRVGWGPTEVLWGQPGMGTSQRGNAHVGTASGSLTENLPPCQLMGAPGVPERTLTNIKQE